MTASSWVTLGLTWRTFDHPLEPGKLTCETPPPPTPPSSRVKAACGVSQGASPVTRGGRGGGGEEGGGGGNYTKRVTWRENHLFAVTDLTGL